LDYGERRIGLALSDPTGTIASPLETLSYRHGKRPPLQTIERIARTHGVERIVLGLPLDLAGEETERCRTVREIGEQLGRRLELPVEYLDERMTSVQAQRALREIGLKRSQREQKARVDAAAAAVILQRWLDRRGHEPTPTD
jgi:putative Holliday junction resolvase